MSRTIFISYRRGEDDGAAGRLYDRPDELKDLPRSQAIRIAHDRFRDDAERLARWLERVLAEVEALHEAKRRQAEEEARRQAEEAKRRQAEKEARPALEPGRAERRSPRWPGAKLAALAANRAWRGGLRWPRVDAFIKALEPMRAKRRDLRWPRLGSFVTALQPRLPGREWLIALAPLVALTAAGVWYFRAPEEGVKAPDFPPPPPMETTAELPPDPAPPDAAALWSQIDTVPCAVLTWDLNGSVVVLSGHARDVASIDALARNLRAIPGITDVVNAVAPLDDVHCRPIELVKPYAVANRELGLSITPAMATFTAGEGLPLRVGGTSRNGYLYVDHYRADSTVLHMLPRLGVSHYRLLAQTQSASVKAAASERGPYRRLTALVWS